MTYLITYSYYGEPHTVECELRDGKYWSSEAVSVPFESIIRVEERGIVLLPTCITLPHPKYDSTLTITNKSGQEINITT